MLQQSYFWEKLHGDKILIWQEDSIVFRKIEDKFLKYDYVGAPWENHRVGNGGISLRSRQTMLRCIKYFIPNQENIIKLFEMYGKLIQLNKNEMEKHKLNRYFEEIINEDCHFTKILDLYKFGSIAPFEIANEFSVEHVKYANPCCAHQFWHTYKDNWKEWMLGNLKQISLKEN